MPLEQEVVERLVHSSGDLGVASGVRFSPGACALGLDSLLAGAAILTDTAMAAAAVAPALLLKTCGALTRAKRTGEVYTPLGKVKDELYAKAYEEKREEAFNQWMKKLWERSSVNILQ